MNAKDVIKRSKHWVNDFVIQHNICPFAKREYDNDAINFTPIKDNKLEEQLQALIEACTQLDKNTSIETTLLIYPNGLNDFDDYLDFLDLANQLLDKQGYEGVYQLASFHPDYCFEGVDADDASNYTNRSPYPMLHLLRETSLEKALANYPSPEAIPQRNIAYLRKLLVETLRNSDEERNS